MSLDTTVSAIIGGCVAGGVILVVIIALIIYFACGCRGGGRRKRTKPFSQLSTSTSAHTSPSHSQPSSMGPATEDARLPKVGNGLWLGSPSLYTAAPPSAYPYGRPSKERAADHACSLHRTSSEKRMPHGAVLVPSLAGPPRIYHSQQLTPAVQVLNPRTPSVYNVYQVEGSRTHLLGDDKANYHGRQKGGDLERRHSDATSSGRKASQKHFSNTRSLTGETREVLDSPNKLMGRLGGGLTNFAFSSEEGVERARQGARVVDHGELAVASSATDSMKLLAKNKTDDQKQVSHALLSPSPQEPGVLAAHSVPYSVSQNIDGHQQTGGQLSLDNPILACMQAMVLDRSDSGPSLCGHDNTTDIGERTGSLVAGLLNNPTTGTPVMHNPLYQEPDSPKAEKHSTRTAYSTASALQCDQEQGGVVTAHRPSSLAEAQDQTDKRHVSLDVCARKAEATADNFHRVDDAISKQTDLVRSTPETEDDLSRDGKHITAAAFEFLDNYLSDDDSNDLQSPPLSPSLSARGQQSY